LPDDELTIEEATAAQFIPKAADLLKTDAETLKARLKALGYGSIPGKPAERVAAYRKLRADLGAADDLMGVAGQPPLVTVDATAGQRSIRIRRTAKTRYRSLSIGAGGSIGPREAGATPPAA
jgi:hypothetical protein